MALSQRLEFRQTQALVMTPQLMQAIKLLQLSSLDLAAYVEGELERNPLLERADDEEAPPAAAEAEDAGEGGGDELATGQAQPPRQSVAGLEQLVRQGDGCLHTGVIPPAYRGVKLPNQLLRRRGILPHFRRHFHLTTGVSMPRAGP